MENKPTKIIRSRARLDGPSINLTLPDNSVVRIDKKTLRFHSVDPKAVASIPAKPPAIGALRSTESINFEMLAGFLEKPHRRFSDCFRRISDDPCYSPKQSVHDFSVESITRIYSFPGDY